MLITKILVGFSRLQVLRGLAVVAGLLAMLTGCNILPEREAEAQSQSSEARGSRGPASVDAAIARTGSLQSVPEYTGTTEPLQEVSLRSQAEGQLLDLRVDVGDRVSRGQVLARLNDNLLVAAVLEAEAELAALESEVVRAQTQVGNARTQVEQARLTLSQAQADAGRSQQLARAGAIARQAAQLDQTEAQTAVQGWRSAQVQVRTEQQAVAAAQRRVAAQQAVVAQAQEQQSYSVLRSPVTGLVLQRPTESGNLVRIGDEVLRLGDFSRVKVVVQVSELELANVRVGQSARVRLDAFPNQQLTGEVVRISPVADPTARLLPVEVTIPNPDSRTGSGLLARVSFAQRAVQRIVVPETALQETAVQKSNRSTLFVVTGEGDQAKVAARQVAVGKRADGQVEILSGLKPGERFVARSGKPLKDGAAVRLSILSERS